MEDDGTGKIEIFAWRLCNDSLPTRKNLKQKNVLEEYLCPFCSQVTEDASHAIFTCSTLGDLWTQHCPELGVTSLPSYMDINFFTNVLKKDNELQKVFMIAWGVWNRRDRKIFEDTLIQPQEEVVHSALDLMEDFMQTQMRRPNNAPKALYESMDSSVFEVSEN